MSLPLLDLSRAPRDELVAALREHGALRLRDPRAEPLAERALADARAFFALASPEKQALAIERSPHFRGYSEMHNERDWREQLHFGPERPAVVDAAEPFWRLQGPNAWPADDAWRARMLAWFSATERAGRDLLARIADAFGSAAEPWLGAQPYVLAKCIGYAAQPTASARRRGVAAHLDFSLLTLTLQDDTGGLEVRAPDGAWRPVPPTPGTWLVNVGELLQLATGNRLIATPHRVVNPSAERARVSIPVFLAPSLDTRLRAMEPAVPLARAASAEHVHAVLDPTSPPPALHFGAAEWRRKGENVWCGACVSARAASAGPTAPHAPA